MKNLINKTSHTVLIIDQRGSMKKADVPNHRSRSRAVYYTLANDMVLVPLRNNILSYTDVVTIIEMRDDAHVICYMEPVSIYLYNKLVDLTLKDIRDIGGQGNYILSLRRAE